LEVQMKKIVLVALLAAAGCNKKSGADCDGAIAKGMDNFKANIKEHAANPQITERMMGVVDKLRGTLVERCKEDKWADEVVTCYTTVHDRKDMQGCQTKLTPDQQSKLTAEITKVMMGGTAGMQRMPPGMAGHPGTLQPSTGDGAAPAAPAAPAEPAAPPAAPAAPAAPAGGSAAPAAPAAGGW
jgi:hypothetical protein